jgi:O-antigen ligase
MNPDTVTRLTSAYQGDLSGRENLVTESLNMILEKPLLGWGPGVYRPLLGNDAHNLFLHLLIEVGIVGTVPYVIGLFLCFLSAWKARKSESGKICLIAFSTIMIANLALNWAAFKPMWLLIAASLAGAERIPQVHLSRTNLRFAAEPKAFR